MVCICIGVFVLLFCISAVFERSVPPHFGGHPLACGFGQRVLGLEALWPNTYYSKWTLGGNQNQSPLKIPTMDIIIKTFLSINMICRLVLVACLLSPSIFKSSMGTMTSRVKHQTFVLLLLLRKLVCTPLLFEKHFLWENTTFVTFNINLGQVPATNILFYVVH